MTLRTYKVDPKLDLVLDRVIDVPKELVWKAWTNPEYLKKWFSPKPWQTTDCRIDLRAGGEFYTEMQSPEGQKFPGSGCILEVIPNERLVWTSALLPDYRPQGPAPENAKECSAMAFTCVLTLVTKGKGTHYTAHVMHGNVEQTKAHEKMGFHEGWGTCLDQLVAYVKTWK
ncbi:MAG: polyketide cyclase [Proteobacteria bacterium]|nr:polyketide cyclase [Pseudomonadota bacterium]